ncbi:ATP-binding protein, partial [Streptomyces sp. SID6137]|nr:ATP-binding protein [Streptomyces sp. SID6137]
AQQAAGGVAGAAGNALGDAAAGATKGGLPTANLPMQGLPLT